MKKILGLFGILLCVSMFAYGCGKQTKDYVRENMSEKTEVYFYGENEKFYVTLSSGQREDVYLMNGKSEDKVDFSLLTINFFNETFNNLIDAKLYVNDEEKVVNLELNNLNSTYMVDLETAFSGDEEISIDYKGQKLSLQNKSKDFGVNADKAIEIASKELSKFIMKEKKLSSLNAECYLRVLDSRANDFEDLFWVFTVVNIKNENYSVVISTVDGSVLSKSE